MGTSVQIYLADHDDVFPRGWGWDNGIGHMWNYWHDIPANWRTNDPAYVDFASGSSLNSTEPYRKNRQMLELAGGFGSFRPFAAAWYTAGNRAAKNGLAYNGLLHTYSSTAVNSPSQLPLYTQIGGNLNADGADTGPLPALMCNTASQPCIYQPAASATTCSSSVNGRFSYFFYPNASQWLYGRSQTWVFAGSSAKSRPMAMNVNGRTDFRNDPFTNYTPNGVDRQTAWYDGGYCHALIFRPDFDFQTWPAVPIAGF
jgi:hypothetical protein